MDVSKWEPTRWWRVTYADGRRYGDGRLAVWCETSDEEEAREAAAKCPDGGVLMRLYERSERQWLPVPTVAAHEGDDPVYLGGGGSYVAGEPDDQDS